LTGNQLRKLSSTAKSKDEFTSRPVPVEEVRRYATDCMVAAGTKRENASALANVLVAADYRGHYSHGLNRLGTVSKFVMPLTTLHNF